MSIAKNYYFQRLKALKFVVAIAIVVTAPFKTFAQSEVNIPDNAPERLERTAPRPNRPLTPNLPQPKPKPNLEVPDTPQSSECLESDDRKYSRDAFYVRDVEVLGNTVLQPEIDAEIARFKRHVVTLEDLVCLRSQITNLYLDRGYITSGAFIPKSFTFSLVTLGFVIILEKIILFVPIRLNPR